MPRETEAQVASSHELPGESVFPDSAGGGAETGNAHAGSMADGTSDRLTSTGAAEAGGAGEQDGRGWVTGVKAGARGRLRAASGRGARRPLIATAARRRPRITGQLLACAVTFAALVVTGCGGPAGPVEPRQPPRCSSLLFVGVRGSGEDPSQQLAMGTTVYPVYAGVRSADPRLAGYGWPYNAERPGITDLRHAAAALAGFLNARARHCPAERIILAGYSAGAQIVGDALQSPALTAAARSRVTAAVMLADPEFNPADTHTAAGTFDPRHGGAPRRAAFAAPLAGRIRSYCRRHDIVCQRRDRAADKNQHGTYVPQQTGQATDFIERTADLRQTKP